MSLVKDTETTEGRALPARRILVLLAHSSLDRSEANHPLAQATSRVDGVTLVDLYAEYPDFGIDVDEEQAFLARVEEHRETLKDVMEADRLQLHDRTERGWTPPPKGYTDEING